MIKKPKEAKTARNLQAPSVSVLRLTVHSTLMLLLLSAGTVHAGGLYVNEFGSPSTGTAGAGAQAWANDASATWHNEAGMTRIEGNQITLGAGIGSIDAEFDPDPNTPFSGGDGGDAGDLVPILGTYGVLSVTDDLKLGLGIFSVSGAALDYDDGWAGRYQVNEITILTVSANPTIAYRVTDWLSVGGGPMFTYGDLEFKLSVPPGGNGRAKLDGDDIAVGFTLGALVEFSPQTRVGVSYLSEQNFEFEGDLEVQPLGLNLGTDTDLDLAQVVRVGAYHEFNDQWAVLGTVGWEDWSTLTDLFIATDGGSAAIPRNWDDTYHYSIGVHYKPTQHWLLQTGFTYDSSPVDSEDRTADMPIDRQLRYAVGAQYQFSETMTFGGALEYVDFGEANIKNSNTLIGDYETNRGIFFQANLIWKL